MTTRMFLWLLKVPVVLGFCTLKVTTTIITTATSNYSMCGGDAINTIINFQCNCTYFNGVVVVVCCNDGSINSNGGSDNITTNFPVLMVVVAVMVVVLVNTR